MTTVTIELNDATELANQNWLAPLAKRSISLTAREIKMGDARDAGRVLERVDEAGGDLYGFIPIPAGGTTVTNELVNKLREDLGI